MPHLQRITPFLWFSNEAEQAAAFYTGVFRNSKVGTITRYTDAGQDQHKMLPGTVMTVEFELDGQVFTALNGGPLFKFNESVSFVIHCDSQAEVDHFWEELSKGGDPKAQQCGWLKDKYGLSWQVVPDQMIEMLKDPDPAKSKRVMQSMMKMKKNDLGDLKRAYAGESLLS